MMQVRAEMAEMGSRGHGHLGGAGAVAAAE